MNNLINLMQSIADRAVRTILGLALIYVGLAVVGGTAGISIAAIGVLPIVMGAWGPCLLGFVFKPA